MLGVTVEEIKDELWDLDIEVKDANILQKFKDFCDIYNIDANKISCEYFSFNAKSKIDENENITLERLQQFEQDKLKHLREARKPLDPIEGTENLPDCAEVGTPKRPVSLSSKRNLTPDAPINKRFVSAIGSPSVASPHSQSLAGSQPSCKFAERGNRGEIVLSHNKDQTTDFTPSNTPPAISFTDSTLKEPYRYMFESLRERAASLDEVICRTGDVLMESLGLTEFMDTRRTSVDPQVAVGRVCCDSEGHLNSNSVVLQGSMDTCGGHVIPLDLSKLDSYSLFPGQIVGVECTNPNGSKLLVSKLYTDIPVQPPAAVQTDQVMEVMVCCGPYIPDQSEDIQPLLDLLEVIKASEPHVVLMIGPFVDMQNPRIDQSAQPHERIFENMLKEIYEAVESLKTEVVLLPSQRDAHENFVYPQPPYGIDEKLWNGKIRSLPDPGEMKINDLFFGVTSSDILLHLGKEELSFPPRSGDRFSRLASHLLTQRSFYPLYPPGIGQNIDFEHQEKHGLITRTPHLLILPSDVIYFVRELKGCTVVNPGRLTKGLGGGTYSKISLKTENGVTSSKVEIIRI